PRGTAPASAVRSSSEQLRRHPSLSGLQVWTDPLTPASQRPPGADRPADMRSESIRPPCLYGAPNVGAGVRVGVDARHLGAGRGVARYTGELLLSLARYHPDDQWLLFVPGSARVAQLDTLNALPNVSVKRHPMPGRALFGAAALSGRPRLDRLIGATPD